MASYSPLENARLRQLAAKHARNGSIPDSAWQRRIGPAFNRATKKEKRPSRKWRTLKAHYWWLQQQPGRSGTGRWDRFKKSLINLAEWGDKALVRNGTTAELRAKVKQLLGEKRALSVRAEAAESAYRKIEQAVGSAKRRAANALVEHSRD